MNNITTPNNSNSSTNANEIILCSLTEICQMRDGKPKNANQYTFNIPAVQRGLVWNAQQSIDLWDSLSKGYPIGSLTVYESENALGSKILELLDGQQRMNSICMGFRTNNQNTKNLNTPRIWVRITKNGDHDELIPQFMVCTYLHPWGFKKEGHEKLNANEKFNFLFNFYQTLNKNKVDLSSDEKYNLIPVQDAWPHIWTNTDTNYFPPLPLEWILNQEDKKIDEFVSENYKNYFDPNKLTNWDNLKENICKSRWFENIQNYQIPIIKIAKNVLIKGQESTQRDEFELFSRINRNGSKLTTSDENYSLISYEMGTKLKSNIETTARNFLSPSRFCNLMARLSQAELKDNQFQSKLSPSTLLNLVKNEDFKKKFNEIIIPKSQNSLEKFKKLTVDLPDFSRLPDDQDDWLFVIFWLMNNFEGSFKKCDSNEFHLLMLLPDLIPSTSISEGRNTFIKKFHEGVNKLFNTQTRNDLNASILNIMAHGLVPAICSEKTFCFPFPCLPEKNYLIDLLKNILTTDVNQSAFEQKIRENYQNRWIMSFGKIWGTKTNSIINYYQKSYLQLIANAFNRDITPYWEQENRPWDMDHIIPQSWWNNEACKDFTGNMQCLHFSDNRAKQNNYASLAPDPNNASQNLFNTHKHKFDTATDSYKDDSIIPRFVDIITTTYEQLNIENLIYTINNLENHHSTEYQRFLLFKDVYEAMKKEGWDNIEWAGISYDWRARRTNVNPTYMQVLSKTNEIIPFYHSLTEWLSLGIPLTRVNNDDSTQKIGFLTITCPSYFKNIELGIRRNIGERSLNPDIMSWYNNKLKSYIENSNNDLIKRLRIETNENSWWYVGCNYQIENDSNFINKIMNVLKELKAQVN